MTSRAGTSISGVEFGWPGDLYGSLGSVLTPQRCREANGQGAIDSPSIEGGRSSCRVGIPEEDFEMDDLAPDLGGVLIAVQKGVVPPDPAGFIEDGFAGVRLSE